MTRTDLPVRVLRRLLPVLILAAFCLDASCGLHNKAPSAPELNGPESGYVGVPLEFTATAADPDGDSVSIRFDWGDGDTSDWSAWVPNGTAVADSHVWSSPSTYAVRALARDRAEAQTEWSTPRSVSIGSGWTRTFGGAARDYARSVVQTADGGYTIAGYTSSYGAGDYDAWLIKTDAEGNILWDRAFGGDRDDGAHSVTLAYDGGCVLAGYTYSYGDSSRDAWLIRSGPSGDTLWTRSFGGPDDDCAYSVAQASDGGYILAGRTRSPETGYDDAWLARTDASGNMLWNRTYGGEHHDCAQTVLQTADGGFIFAGTFFLPGASLPDAWLVKTDAHGDTLWTRTFGGTGYDCGLSLAHTRDGGFIFAGYTYATAPDNADFWLVKTDADGSELWSRTFDGTDDDFGISVTQTVDDGYAITGNTYSSSAGYTDAWLIRTDAEGNMLWDKTFGGTAEDGACSVQQTSDLGFILAGSTQSYGAGNYDAWVIKTDPLGNTSP